MERLMPGWIFGEAISFALELPTAAWSRAIDPAGQGYQARRAGRTKHMARGEVTEKDDAALFTEVLGRATEALEHGGVPFALFGSVASNLYGRPCSSGDIDLLVAPRDADRALETLAAAGFSTEQTDPTWIYKATWDGVLVDVIFKVKAGVYLDDEMLSRVQEREYRGQRVRLVAPEDAVVIEAVSDEDQSRDHWFAALAILAAVDLDWDYLERRARYGARRVLSLLLYAESNDYVVPERTVRRLFDAIYPGESG